MALDNEANNVVRGLFTDNGDPLELAQENNKRAQELGVALDPIGLLAERINLVLTTVGSKQDVHTVELRYQRIIEATLDRAERERDAALEAEAKAQLLLPPSGLVVPDVAGGDVRGDRNSSIRRINDTWGE